MFGGDDDEGDGDVVRDMSVVPVFGGDREGDRWGGGELVIDAESSLVKGGEHTVDSRGSRAFGAFPVDFEVSVLWLCDFSEVKARKDVK